MTEHDPARETTQPEFVPPPEDAPTPEDVDEPAEPDEIDPPDGRRVPGTPKLA